MILKMWPTVGYPSHGHIGVFYVVQIYPLHGRAYAKSSSHRYDAFVVLTRLQSDSNLWPKYT